MAKPLGNADERELEAARACAHLAAADSRLAALIQAIGPYRPRLTPDPFAALAGSIVHQQVSMTAAASIWRRLRLACGGRVRPASVLALSSAQMRAAGLSARKTEYMRGVAAAFDARILSTRRLRGMSDEEVVAAVTELKGIGRWTAEMLLIFSLARPDVWPAADLGLQRAAAALMNGDRSSTARQIKKDRKNHRGNKPASRLDVSSMLALAERWRPYRTYAAWYLWRSLEGPLAPSITL